MLFSLHDGCLNRILILLISSLTVVNVQLFEGGPHSKFQGAKDIAHFRAKEGKRPAFSVNTYPPHMKE